MQAFQSKQFARKVDQAYASTKTIPVKRKEPLETHSPEVLNKQDYMSSEVTPSISAYENQLISGTRQIKDNLFKAEHSIGENDSEVIIEEVNQQPNMPKYDY